MSHGGSRSRTAVFCARAFGAACVVSALSVRSAHATEPSGGAGGATATVIAAPAANATPATVDPNGAPPAEDHTVVTPLSDGRVVAPPPTHVVYFQYGVAFTAEAVASAGPMCNAAGVPCILGPGAGIAVRAGWRSSGALYLGGAYELTKQDPNKLFRLALLQQARAEARYYIATARVTEPYFSGGLGVAGYGNEWSVDTWGPAGFLGAGVEYQITRRTTVGLALAYRLLHFSSFTDTSGAARDGGFAQLIGLDLVLEQRDPIDSTDASTPSTKTTAKRIPAAGLGP